MASRAASSSTRSVYRELIHIINRMPAQDRTKHLVELRSSFRQPITGSQTVENRLAEAQSRLSFLRMTVSSKELRRSSNTAGTWVYKDGERLAVDGGVGGTLRDEKGRVVSNWDGSNLDPESVKRHKQQLRRAGFVNNTHAKGIF